MDGMRVGIVERGDGGTEGRDPRPALVVQTTAEQGADAGIKLEQPGTDGPATLISQR